MNDDRAPDDGHKAEVNDELAAMRRFVAALQPLDQASRRRVLTWLFDRYPIETDGPSAT